MQSHEYLSLGREETTQKTTQNILRAIEENSAITREGLARLLGITPDGVKYHLDNLKKKGLIKRFGGRKEGIWIVEKKEGRET